ncbi:Uncharacterised protein [Legionella lansingensis]|uniref:Outer membrane protein beta-barrel domain-containing protein n=1 Tax=Legionella lansingensis TaxID=45067 RepID=A0A0W0VTG7_9GAMM|nr:hypothetical protein [Legionella lansingensis]KTD23370.1 hypothetical protein Llan_0869 [Legionella lansingensis]SNV49426.1 Uncharacterised protein [Legionella lansingensis]
MTHRTRMIALGCVLSFNALAGTYLPAITIEESQGNRWSIIASLGYGQYEHAYSDDGQTPLGRLAVGAELLTTTQTAFGLEFGVQNGNRMRVGLPPGTLDILGGVVRTTVKPMLDLLFTANTTPISESLLFAQLKGGIAYRQWEMETNLINNKTELAGEVQAGFGYPLTEITSLNLLYQGVFGGNTRFHPPLNDAGRFSSIPTQHGILFGFSVIA